MFLIQDVAKQAYLIYLQNWTYSRTKFHYFDYLWNCMRQNDDFPFRAPNSLHVVFNVLVMQSVIACLG